MNPDDADPGPDAGHTFRIVATGRMSSSVVGLPGHVDADWWGPPMTLDVRAWDLPAALRAAADAWPDGGWGLGRDHPADPTEPEADPAVIRFVPGLLDTSDSPNPSTVVALIFLVGAFATAVGVTVALIVAALR